MTAKYGVEADSALIGPDTGDKRKEDGYHVQEYVLLGDN